MRTAVIDIYVPRRRVRDWEEAKHPRGNAHNAGQFASHPGAGKPRVEEPDENQRLVHIEIGKMDDFSEKHGLVPEVNHHYASASPAEYWEGNYNKGEKLTRAQKLAAANHELIPLTDSPRSASYLTTPERANHEAYKNHMMTAERMAAGTEEEKAAGLAQAAAEFHAPYDEQGNRQGFTEFQENRTANYMKVAKKAAIKPTDEQKLALGLYTGKGNKKTKINCSKVNAALREGGALDENEKAMVNGLDSYISHCKMPADTVLYRTVNGKAMHDAFDGLKPGDIVSQGGYTSTATEKDTYKKLKAGGGASSMRILAKKGSTGAYVGPYSAYKEECEVLLPRDAKLRYTGRGAYGAYMFEYVY